MATRQVHRFRVDAATSRQSAALGTPARNSQSPAGHLLAFSALQDWLKTQPKTKSVRAYLRWREQRNKELDPGQYPYPSYPTICQFWSGTWSELIAASEGGRLPSGSPTGSSS